MAQNYTKGETIERSYLHSFNFLPLTNKVCVHMCSQCLSLCRLESVIGIDKVHGNKILYSFGNAPL